MFGKLKEKLRNLLKKEKPAKAPESEKEQKKPTNLFSFGTQQVVNMCIFT